MGVSASWLTTDHSSPVLVAVVVVVVVSSPQSYERRSVLVSFSRKDKFSRKRRNIIRPPFVVPITETGSVIHVLVHLLHTCAHCIHEVNERRGGVGGCGHHVLNLVPSGVY